MPELDPGIHPASKQAAIFSMDCRAKPGNDEMEEREP
jgi:hypothetical protein